ncbi:MAG: phosphoribosylamine--glycine ligase [Clostridia bacterium]|nr:phosphoribosylamine--glycine ligase [Clostridia bacterium]
MKVLVIGSGGREHAICVSLAKSPKLTKLYCAPGNAGIASVAECVNIGVLEFDKIIGFAKDNAIDLVFVAPDDPLSQGLVNRLQEADISAFGPRSEAAIIEGSKAFSKAFMKRHNIPTAAYEVFDNYDVAEKYLIQSEYPIVIKADGLALGKGVIICATRDEAVNALKSIMLDKVFGTAGNQVVIEEFLSGSEATVLAFTDGYTVKCMPASQDHKKAYDNDKGLNTGGMGAFAPTPHYTESIEKETLENIILPTIKGLREEDRKFSGVIYFGLMLTSKGVKVIEYNARFGDPETQVILPLLKTDLLEIIQAVNEQRLESINIEWKEGTGFCVVVASGGYPENVIKGYEITIKPFSKNIELFHSGTAFKNGKLVTNGGRVICVATVAKSIEAARKAVYAEIDNIQFRDARYRKDIGIK